MKNVGKWIGKNLLGIIIGIVIGSSVVYAAGTVTSQDVTYNGTTVEGALNDLYGKASVIGSTTAGAGNVLVGTKFVSSDGTLTDGTMANQGVVSQTINPGESYTIPAGYHNGSGKVTANANTGTYTYAANSTGRTVDMGATNTYRYVNAANVYAKGKADGKALSVRTTGSGNYTSNRTLSVAVGDIIVWGYCIAGDYTTDYNLASYTTGASLIGQFIIRNDGPIAKVGVFRATSTSVTLRLPSGRLGYIVTKS